MQFKVDENLPSEIKELLVTAGYSVATVLEQKLGGQPDGRIIEICKAEKRALITLDWDFSDIRTYPPNENSGIIVLNPPNESKNSIINMVTRLIPFFKKERLSGCLWISEPDRIRIREGDTSS